MEDRTPLGEVAKTTAVVLLVYAAAVVVVEARLALLLTFFAVVLASVLSFPIDWLARRMSRWAAVLVTLLVCVALVVVAVVLVVPVVRNEIAQLPDQLGRARDQLDTLLGGGGAAATTVQKVVDKVPPQAAEKALPIVASTIEGISTVILLVVLAFFLVSERDGLHVGLRRLLPRRHVDVFDEWWRRSGGALRRWVGGIVVSMAIMGTLAGLGLWAVGIQGALFLGLLTFIGTFVPYLGAGARAIPGIAVARAQSPRHALYATAVYVGVHIVEGYLVQPIVMKRAIELRPSLLLVWQAGMGMVFGIPGVIVATPLLAVVQSSVDYLWVERKLMP